jgi:hypothetical protein
MFLQKALRASLAVVLACGLASFSRAIVTTARSETAQETADAAEALARMGKTLSAKRFSFQSRTFRSYAGPNGELLHIVHTTKTIYDRPDRLSVSVTGDDGSIKIVYDGNTLVLYAAEAKQYVSVPVTGNIEKALDVLEERTSRRRVSSPSLIWQPRGSGCCYFNVSATVPARDGGGLPQAIRAQASAA